MMLAVDGRAAADGGYDWRCAHPALPGMCPQDALGLLGAQRSSICTAFAQRSGHLDTC